MLALLNAELMSFLASGSSAKTPKDVPVPKNVMWLSFIIEALISIDAITQFLLDSTDSEQFPEQLITELAARPYQVPLPSGPLRT